MELAAEGLAFNHPKDGRTSSPGALDETSMHRILMMIFVERKELRVLDWRSHKRYAEYSPALLSAAVEDDLRLDAVSEALDQVGRPRSITNPHATRWRPS